MKKRMMTLLLILAGIAGYCQDSSLWFRTESENTEVVGYKDQSGTLRIGHWRDVFRIIATR